MEQRQPHFSYSIIIPSLNEEKRIETVIRQFHALDGKYKYEVIVGDGGSTDRTVEIARSLGATVVIDSSPTRTVGSGRDSGAAIATGDMFIFCDADTRLSNVVRLVEEIEKTFRDPKVVAAVPRMEVFPEQQIWKDKIFHHFFNALIRFSLHLPGPLSRGQCQIVRATSFRAVGGYDKTQVHAEDSYLFLHLKQFGKLKFINDVTVYESPRRYRKYGYLKVALIGIYSTWAQAIFKRNVLKSWDRVE